MTARVVPDDPGGWSAAAAVLVDGGVVAIPTDTVYGIAVALATPGGIERLFRIKERPPDKAIVLLIDELAQVAEQAAPAAAAAVLASLWPGGLTLVMRAAETHRHPEGVLSDHETIAVRIPDHPTPRFLARIAGPLPTTSANLSGAPDARTADEVVAVLGERIDLVVDGGPSPGGVPSTVVDVSGPVARILRAGLMPTPRIVALLEAAGIPCEPGS